MDILAVLNPPDDGFGIDGMVRGGACVWSVCITPAFMMEAVGVGDVIDWSMGLTVEEGEERERETAQDEGGAG